MRSLWQLIFRYHVFLLFLILQAVAITMLVRSNSYHYSSYVNASNLISGQLYEKRAVVAEYLKLQTINEELARENALLKSEAPLAFLKLGENIYLYNDTLHLRRYEYMPARVINNSVNRARNFITIDKGRRNGIDRGMGVATKGTVVGIVKDVSEHFAVVMPLINTGFNLSVKLDRSDAFGSIAWSGQDPTLARMKDVPRYANPLRGDSVTTTGFSTFFPEGLLVGTVESYRIPEGENFYEIDVRLSTTFYSLSYVDVIHNLLADEQRTLEEASQQIND